MTMSDIRGYDVNHINKLEADIQRLRAENKQLLIDLDEQAERIAELESQVETLQNRCANRGLSPEDSDALQAENEWLRVALETLAHRSNDQWSRQVADTTLADTTLKDGDDD